MVLHLLSPVLKAKTLHFFHKLAWPLLSKRAAGAVSSQRLRQCQSQETKGGPNSGNELVSIVRMLHWKQKLSD